jgi:hypothetical protein
MESIISSFVGYVKINFVQSVLKSTSNVPIVVLISVEIVKEILSTTTLSTSVQRNVERISEQNAFPINT